MLRHKTGIHLNITTKMLMKTARALLKDEV